jgi:hypothetical protein
VAAAPQPGEHVVHVGAGVGYYTAILAELVGVAGRVKAIEFDAELAARATANFVIMVRIQMDLPDTDPMLSGGASPSSRRRAASRCPPLCERRPTPPGAEPAARPQPVLAGAR